MPTIVLTREEHTRLTRAARAPSTPQRFARRSAIVLMASEGASVTSIADRLGVSTPTVRLWIRRFLGGGVDAIMQDAAGRGRPSAVDDAALMAALAAATSGTARHRSIRALARDLGVSASSVWRALQKTGQPIAGSSTSRRHTKSQ